LLLLSWTLDLTSALPSRARWLAALIYRNSIANDVWPLREAIGDAA
jgi:hypothetical protein